MDTVTRSPVSGLIEILDRSGQVQQRLPYRGEPLTVGRAYDNDVILSDPYVSPHHLVIQPDDSGMLQATDLDSTNGLFDAKSLRRQRQVKADETHGIRIGHTIIRFRQLDYQVPEARKDTSTDGLLRHLEKSWLRTLLVLTAIICFAIAQYAGIIEPFGLDEVLSQLFFPVLLIILWSGLWAMVNRIVAHRWNYWTHVAITCAAIATNMAAGTLMDYIGFGLAVDSVSEWGSTLLEVGIISGMLYAHMRYATHGKPGALAVTAATLTTVVNAWLALDSTAYRTKFNPAPQYELTLKAPAFQFKAGSTVDDFFNRSEALKPVDPLASEQGPGSATASAAEPDDGAG